MDKEDKVFKVAAIQLSPVLFDRDSTTEKVIKNIEKCGEEGIRLAVFPETFIPNYPYFAWLNPPAVISDFHGKLYDQAVDVPGPVTEAVGKATKGSGTVVVLGVNEREGGSLPSVGLPFDTLRPGLAAWWILVWAACASPYRCVQLTAQKSTPQRKHM